MKLRASNATQRTTQMKYYTFPFDRVYSCYFLLHKKTNEFWFSAFQFGSQHWFLKAEIFKAFFSVVIRTKNYFSISYMAHKFAYDIFYNENGDTIKGKKRHKVC